MTGHWQHFHHEADVGVRGVGDTPAEAFAAAALALTAVITDPAKIAASEAVSVHCEGTDLEMLFVDWLNSLVYEMDTRHMLFGRFEVRIEGGHLDATAWGEPVDVGRHEPCVEVKGATFTELRVAREGDGWLAQCVVDV